MRMEAGKKGTDIKRAGTFYGVGVGPGDPELMTLKALRVLKEAKVIAAPVSKGSAHNGSNALAVVKKNLSLEGKTVLDLLFPMTKDEAVLRESRMEAASKIAGRLRDGDDVVFVTLGDPLLYSTFSYLIPFVSELSPLSAVRAVPGVNSFSAAVSRAVIPLAESGGKVIIVPAAYDNGDLRTWLKEFETVVLMKVSGGGGMDPLIEILTEEGLADKALFASRIGMEGEEVVTGIRGLRGKKTDYFSMVIVRR